MKTGIWVIIITLFSQLSGFLRDVVFASKFGASWLTDSLVFAQSIDALFTGVVLVGLRTVVVPLYLEYKARNSDDFKMFLNTIWGCTAVAAVFLLVFGEMLAPNIVHLVSGRFLTEQSLLTVKLFRYIFPGFALACFMTLANSFLIAEERYLHATVIGIPYNLVLLIYLTFLSGVGGVVGFALAIPVAIMVQNFVQWPFVKFSECNVNVLYVIDKKIAGRLIVLTLPVMFSSGIQQMNQVIDRIFASGLAVGSISMLSYSLKITAAINGLIISIVSSIYFSKISKYIANDDRQMATRYNTKMIYAVIFVTASIAIAVISVSDEVITLVFGRGRFDRSAIQVTAEVLRYHSPAVISSGISTVLLTALYASKKTTIVIWSSMVAIALDIVFSFVLKRYLGIKGLAIANTIASFGAAAVLIFFSKNRVSGIQMGHIAKFAIKVILIASVAILLAKVVVACLAGNVRSAISVSMSLVAVFSVLHLIGCKLAGVFEDIGICGTFSKWVRGER